MKKALMRSLAVIALSSLLFVNAVSAVETESSGYTDDPAVAVTLEGSIDAEGKADLSWAEYQGGDLAYYKVVHSQTVETPVYPDDSYVEAISDASVTSYIHEGVKAGTNYYSLCVITTDKLRGCTTITLEKEGETVTEDPKEETPDDPYTDDAGIEITLTGELNDLGKADLSWTKYEGGDLKWYKIVHSQTNAQAYYPVDGYVGVYSDATKTTYTHTDVPAGTNYYRVCAITTENLRGCSNTVELTKGEDVVEDKETTFKDVDTHWAKEYIEDLSDKGVVDGYDDGTFRPDDYVTRSEAIKMIMNNQEKECDATLFPDLNSDHWFCGVVTKAYFIGAVEGSNGYLYPGKEMSRAEAVKVLLVVQGIEPPEIDKDPFTDVEKTQWFAKYVYKASILGYVDGEDGAFDPNRSIRRSELAKIISLAWQ